MYAIIFLRSIGYNYFRTFLPCVSKAEIVKWEQIWRSLPKASFRSSYPRVSVTPSQEISRNSHIKHRTRSRVSHCVPWTLKNLLETAANRASSRNPPIILYITVDWPSPDLIPGSPGVTTRFTWLILITASCRWRQAETDYKNHSKPYLTGSSKDWKISSQRENNRRSLRTSSRLIAITF